MKFILSLLFITCSSSMRFFSKDNCIVTPPGNFIIRTIDGSGKPVKATIVYEFSDCEFDYSVGTTVTADAHGKAIVFFLQSEIYKVQVGTAVQCFQPDQDVHSLQF